MTNFSYTLLRERLSVLPQFNGIGLNDLLLCGFLGLKSYTVQEYSIIGLAAANGKSPNRAILSPSRIEWGILDTIQWSLNVDCFRIIRELIVYCRAREGLTANSRDRYRSQQRFSVPAIGLCRPVRSAKDLRYPDNFLGANRRCS